MMTVYTKNNLAIVLDLNPAGSWVLINTATGETVMRSSLYLACLDVLSSMTL